MVTFDNATATDLSNMVMFISQSHQSGSMFTFGLSIVTFTFEDNSGNTGSCDFSITVGEYYQQDCSVYGNNTQNKTEVYMNIYVTINYRRKRILSRILNNRIVDG